MKRIEAVISSGMCSAGFPKPIGNLGKTSCKSCQKGANSADPKSYFECELASKNNIHVFPMETIDGFYGYLILEVEDKKKYEFYEPFFKNIANSTAIIIEKMRQKTELEKVYKELQIHRDQLEERVKERTCKIEETTEALRKSEEDLRTITDNLPAFIAYIDSDLRYRFNNKSYEKWFGKSPEELYEMHAREILGEATYKQQKPKFDTVLSGKIISFESPARFNDGSEHYLSGSYIPDISEQGKVKGFFVLINDITEQKQAEEEIKQKRKLATIGEMSAYVAHEIKSPLNNLCLSYDLLKNSESIKGKDREALLFMGNGLEKLVSVSTDLLEYSKRKELKKEEFNYLSVMNSLLTELDKKMASAGIKVVRKFPEKCSPLKADHVKVHQIIINTLNNAIQSMPDGGTLSLSTKETEGSLIITISDTGVGIKKKDLDNIFVPFFTTKREGTGLGMTILKDFVDLHNGKVIVESKVGKGTAVTITLPLQ
ncbi:MAG: ATP-binding protein [Deltaproteobacteria bacterium]|nr:ATP-binding protein [Deltaproteobacteria bacterium]